jgi:hypothetical protein
LGDRPAGRGKVSAIKADERSTRRQTVYLI